MDFGVVLQTDPPQSYGVVAVTRTIDAQGHVIVEPYLDRVFDFSARNVGPKQ